MYHSTLGRAYTQLISSFSESAQDHVNLADGLDAQVVNALKLVEKRHEEAKKKVHALSESTHPPPDTGHLSQQVKAFQKLLSDRDRAYGDRTKVRQLQVTFPCVSGPNLTSLEQANGALPVCRGRMQGADHTV